MAINIGINGFGRIGRLVFRSAIINDDFKGIDNSSREIISYKYNNS